ncbi:adenylyltransferase/sulfurtransferase [Oikeobacillus pervagus]|uniref:Adenylyltransferase/sulfurtransferase n=1 Tax=Oikeobacillus pervagus TaxID=1325931 RepID=A0AAJ1WJ44_9BACI|nr:thiazole biosynthesis adenylyltransferase ThiF [Oikeobacillus pervagus]MDQ0215310.1 adenylyltransferase/sulfurtransferase [Oikeobacillus pervagus]
MERYSRQILFPPIGEEGQLQLARKHVLIVGAGALGSSIAEMLVRSGVGKLTMIDRDYVEASNLQRQHLFSEEDAEMRWPKAVAAEKRLSEINSSVEIEAIVGDADAVKLEQLAPTIDLIMDGTDNFETRFVINDISQKYKIPWVYGGCVGSYGMSYTIIPGKTPCLQCLLKNIPMQGMTCDTVGVISPAVQMVTSYQTAEALKILTGHTEEVRPTFVSFDLWRNEHIAIKAGGLKSEDCLSCGSHPQYPFLSYETKTKTAVLCGRNTVQIRPPKGTTYSLQQLALRWKKAGFEVNGNPYLLSVKTDDGHMILFQDGRALIHGTNDEIKAKKIYQSLIG